LVGFYLEKYPQKENKNHKEKEEKEKKLDGRKGEKTKGGFILRNWHTQHHIKI